MPATQLNSVVRRGSTVAAERGRGCLTSSSPCFAGRSRCRQTQVRRPSRPHCLTLCAYQPRHKIETDRGKVKSQGEGCWLPTLRWFRIIPRAVSRATFSAVNSPHPRTQRPMRAQRRSGSADARPCWNWTKSQRVWSRSVPRLELLQEAAQNRK